MANMREIRERIASIQQILKITNAMYLMSSSKLKKARKSLEATEPYFYKLQETIESVLEHTPHTRQMYFDRRSDIPPEKRKKGYIVVTADKGLCGSYNHNILKYTEQELAKSADISNCYLFVIGQVGRQYFTNRNRNSSKASVDGEFLYTTQNPTLYRAMEIAQLILDKFENGELDEVYVLYTDMVNSNLQETRTVQLLPFERRHFGKSPDGTMRKLPKASFLPSPEEVMSHLIPNYAKGIIYGAMVEAFCCEQQSRMTAMDAATTSAKDMIKDLSLLYNRARQAAITQEITEVCGGAASLDENNE
ncbi:MAG: ATP synthase F1 subunit gamma [Ruminococcus sp.]|uniref:ATP synthase F1 subunit gamma n=1 Tax=Ruminococcus sp. TaxID=41978 RepID=UPI0025EC64A5|nr:ATP synthase F1 subunit gamma [Ruminococcus sp.]MBR6394749.1 ATP synthase F1 subunit gamma [Ruminococcus sp.]MCR4639778.1 ATP synthase F1 subunit gamma [Ruminococcus sp.]